jgi:hypothetical protein
MTRVTKTVTTQTRRNDSAGKANVCCREVYCFILAVEIHIFNTAVSRPALRTNARILSQELKQLERETDFVTSSTVVVQNV